MAPRPEQDLEIFTDLNGQPDKADADDAQLLSDDKLGQDKDKKGDDDKDDDLAIVDDAEGDADDADGDEDGDDAGESAEETAQAADQAEPEILFNPADVQVIIAESNNLELRENSLKEAETRAKADIETAKAEMEKAMEDGDTKGHVKASEKFADAKVALGNTQAKLENVGIEKTNLATRAKAVIAKAPKDAEGKAIVDKPVFAKAGGAAPSGQVKKGSTLAAQFTKLNPWFSDPTKAGMKEVVIGIDRALAAEKKLDKNSKEYFAEMGRRFNKLHPGVFKDLDGKLIATGQRQRGTGAQVPNGGGGGGGGGGNGEQTTGKIRLTSQDVQQMRVFNLDPDDPKVRRAWLNEKISTAQADARRGRAA